MHGPEQEEGWKGEDWTKTRVTGSQRETAAQHEVGERCRSQVMRSFVGQGKKFGLSSKAVVILKILSSKPLFALKN